MHQALARRCYDAQVKRAGLLIAFSVPAFLPFALLLDGVFDRIGLLLNPDFFAIDPHQRDEVYFPPVFYSCLALSVLSLAVAAFRCRRSKLWLLPVSLNAATLTLAGYMLITFALEAS